jgi:ABC-type maltose transport system permease subunit
VRQDVVLKFLEDSVVVLYAVARITFPAVQDLLLVLVIFTMVWEVEGLVGTVNLGNLFDQGSSKKLMALVVHSDWVVYLG